MINRQAIKRNQRVLRQKLIDQGKLRGHQSLFRQGDMIYAGVVIRMSETFVPHNPIWHGRHGA